MRRVSLRTNRTLAGSAATTLLVSFVAFTASAQVPSPAPAPASGPDAKIAPAVDRAANEILAAKHVPGVAVAVEKNGAIVFERAYGLADVDRKIPVTPETPFEIGSITKQITAACILQLVEAKKLSLDDHLGTFVSDYFIGRGVTVRQLLGQTSGIPEYLEGPDVVASAGTRPATYATLLARVSAKPLEFAPGTKWKYSNTNYIVLGRIVEIAAGESYETYVRTHVFAPAGMTHAGFISDEAALPNAAHGYVGRASGAAPAPPLRADWARSAGEVIATPRDLIAWDDALLAGKIVSVPDLALMRASGVLADGSPTGYGFGWIVDTLEGHERIWHGGETFGFYALNDTFPNDAETIVVLTNSNVRGADTVLRDAFAATHPDVHTSTSVTAAAPGEDPAITTRVRETLRAFEAGDVDRSQLDATMSGALTPAILASAKEQFAPLGMPQTLAFHEKSTVGAQTVYVYVANFNGTVLAVVMALDADGKIAGFRLRPL